jgi:hypothetical protein
MKKYIVLLAVLFLAGAAQAQIKKGDIGVTVSAFGLFQGTDQLTQQPNTLAFTMSFQYDITTMQGIPHTMLFSEVDTFGLGGFVAPPVGQDYTNFLNPTTGDSIQVGMNELGCCIGNPPVFPESGTYPNTDLLLLCNSFESCMKPLNKQGYNQADGGFLKVSDKFVVTPEPETYLFFAFDALVIGLFLWWKIR